MFTISRIESATFYSNQAFKQMQEIAEKEKDNIKDRFNKSRNPRTKEKPLDWINKDKRKDLELVKVRTLNTKVTIIIDQIIKRFPQFEKMHPLYIDLLETSRAPKDKITQALGQLHYIQTQTDEFMQGTVFKLKKCKSHDTMGFLMKKYMGKVNSLFEKNKSSFETLEIARQFINKLPRFEDTYTVAIAGFPNVGKSTLMNKMSGAKVEIQNYPFTTKGLLFGYLTNESGIRIVQLVDTPGLLGRDDTNAIEKRALIAIQKYCNEIVFVCDATETCGYTLEAQLKLFKQTKELQKPMTLYLSKTDIFNEEDVERKDEAIKKTKLKNVFTDAELITKAIVDNANKEVKLDVTKLRLIK